jgi:hypothetical protein
MGLESLTANAPSPATAAEAPMLHALSIAVA